MFVQYVYVSLVTLYLSKNFIFVRLCTLFWFDDYIYLFRKTHIHSWLQNMILIFKFDDLLKKE